MSQEKIEEIVLGYFDSACNSRGDGVLSFAAVRDLLLSERAGSTEASGARRWIMDRNYASFIVGDRFELSRRGKEGLQAFRAAKPAGRRVRAW
jgi:hypothetical protein